MNLLQFTSRFATVEDCIEHLERVRWREGAYCPHCASSRKIYHYSDGKRHRCADCKRVFRIITGTMFSDSPMKLLPKWFAAIYLVTEHSKGISSVQLAKDIGVNQKTAWHMLHRIQNASAELGDAMLGGDVEIDDTYIGGKERNKHFADRTEGTQGLGSTKTKAVAFGIREREGDVRAFHVPAPTMRNVTPHVLQNVTLGSKISADEAQAYNALDDYYDVRRINHSLGEYVRDDVTTNSIESFWAMVKRTYIGTHHWWSRKHTQRYLDGCAFRQNLESGIKAFALLEHSMLPSAALPFKTLTR